MKKIYMIISMMLLTMFAAMAQAPEKISYQAVVRNASNQLVTNANVGVRVSILQGSATGSAVYAETHTVNTNANGLLTLEIGGGNAQQGSFPSIDWGSSDYYLKTEVDPNGGTNYSITSTQQLMSVPYALYAKTASNGFSGNIADYLTPATTPALTDALQQAGVAMQSDIPSVPENVSAFQNDAGYVTAAQLPVIPENQVLSISNDTIFLTNGGFVKLPAATAGFSGDYNDLQNKPELFDGNYNSLTNKPTIPTVPTNISAFQNDAGYITANDIPEIPTNISDLTNDANYITESVLEERDYITVNDIPEQVNADWNATEGAAQILNKPELFDGNYNSLTNKPTIPTVPTNISAFQNDAGFITADDIPEIPTSISDLTNDANYITESVLEERDYITVNDIPEQVNADWNATEGAAQILNKPELFDGNYNSLTNKPEIPTVPTNVSEFTNDAGYITANDIPEIPTNMSDLTNDANYITESVLEERDYITVNDIPEQVNADWNATEGAAQILNKPELFDGNYNSLTNKPEIPTVPTNVSEFTNDAGYITEADVQAAANIPENISAFTNDAGYITADDIPEIPTSISDLANDANYITESVLEGKDYITVNDIPEQVNADWNATEGAAQILNKPELFSGSYNDLSDKPTIPTVDYINELIDSKVNAMQQKIDSLKNALEATQEELVDIYDKLPFECGKSTVKDHEGNRYRTVLIGNQCWTKENLRTTTSPSTGTYLIPSANNGNTVTETDKQAHWYNNDSATYAPKNYGLLYNWNAAVDTLNGKSVTFTGHRRGICPSGWHLPSDTEWVDLINYVSSRSEYTCGGDSAYVAKALASGSEWSSSTISCTPGNIDITNNVTGFSAVPAGRFISNYLFERNGYDAYFWTSTKNINYSSAKYHRIFYNISKTFTGADFIRTEMSVRCVRDENGSSTATLPTVTTSAVSIISAASATCGGEITADGGADVTARGVCWSTSQNPTVSNSHTTDGTGNGSFTSSITGLTAGTTYYVRAYATNSVGTAYGGEVSFTMTMIDEKSCSTTPTVTDQEGNVYATVQIGNQCWMRDNMRATKYHDGTAIPQGNTESYTDPYYYDYTTSDIDLNQRGYLYNWAAATRGVSSGSNSPDNVQGICPEGWHVPSDAEWTQLTNHVSNESQYTCGNINTYIAKAIAAETGWNSVNGDCYPGDQNQIINNATRFSAVPAGYCNGSSFNSEGNNSFFWSSTQQDIINSAWYRYIFHDDAHVHRSGTSKSYGFSVRCLRD